VWLTDSAVAGDLSQMTIRGWSWWNDRADADAAFRWGVPPYGTYCDVGFRVVTGRDYLFSVQLATDAGFQSGLQESGEQVSRTWYPELASGQTYYWRVQASYPGGVLPSASYWSGSMAARYDAGLDTVLVAGSGLVTGAPGTATGLYYGDLDGDYECDPGEGLWREVDGPAGDWARYSPGVDILLAGTTPAAEAVGIQTGVFFLDRNGNGQHDPLEAVWSKAHYSVFTTSATGVIEGTLPVSAGWNLVSVPVWPIAIEVPPAVALDLTMWEWLREEGRYREVRRFEPRKGFWLFASANGQITVRGYAVDDPRVYVRSGWNLVGIVEPIVDLDMTYLSRPVYGWLGEGYNVLETPPPYRLDSWHGYWIHVPEQIPTVLLEDKANR